MNEEVANVATSEPNPVAASDGVNVEAQGTPQTAAPKATSSTALTSAEAAPKETGERIAPEHYASFDLGDGLEIDEDVFGDYAVAARELGLSQEQAQKLFLSMQEPYHAINRERVKGYSEDWAELSRNDSEIGGGNFEASLKIAQTAYQQFANPALKRLLDETGLGNHPEIIRLFVRVGKAIGQDTGVQAGSAPEPKRKLYPNSPLV